MLCCLSRVVCEPGLSHRAAQLSRKMVKHMWAINGHCSDKTGFIIIVFLLNFIYVFSACHLFISKILRYFFKDLFLRHGWFPSLPWDFYIIHNAPAAQQDQCGRCRIRTRDLCKKSLVHYHWPWPITSPEWATTSPSMSHHTYIYIYIQYIPWCESCLKFKMA